MRSLRETAHWQFFKRSFSKISVLQVPWWFKVQSECFESKIESQFIELMKMLQPKPKYLRLFEAIV